MHSKEHMYVSGLEISRAAAASHKVGKEKSEPRDFKVKKAGKKSPVICTKEIWGYFLLLFKQLCNVYVYMGLSTLAAPSLNRSQNVDNI